MDSSVNILLKGLSHLSFAMTDLNIVPDRSKNSWTSRKGSVGSITTLHYERSLLVSIMRHFQQTLPWSFSKQRLPICIKHFNLGIYFFRPFDPIVRIEWL